MATRQCPTCGGELEPYAGICPHCGALTPMLTGQADAPAPAGAGPPAPRGYRPVERRSMAIGALAGALTVVIVLIAVLFVIHAMHGSTTQCTVARGGETKQDLHDVQLALEKYHQDKEQYPPYLIGGEARYAATVLSGSTDMSFVNISDVARNSVSDPLLREGYLDKYPPNPFIHNGLQVHMVQCNIPSSARGEDPLRNDYLDGEIQGTRFGAQCTTMGNVLADARYSRWIGQSVEYGVTTVSTYDTFADIEYPYWDIWVGERPLPFLPGEFFYKSAGPLAPAGSGEGELAMGSPLPMSIDYYMLGAYGSATDKGQDVLGPEPQIKFDMGRSGVRKVSPWTRSTTGPGEPPEGSPYGASVDKSSPCYPFTYGNPNGISDAVILVLTAE